MGKADNKSRIKTIVAAVVLLAAAGLWYWYPGKEQETDDQPLLAAVRLGSIENTISAAGSLKPSNFVDVGAQVNGILQKLHVEVGDVVEEGQLLAEIDARVQVERVNASRASLQALEAQLDARKSALNLARLNAERQERLRDEEATSQLEYDTAMNNLASAEASLVQLNKQIEQSAASLKTEETQLEFTRIFAPVSGTVTDIAMNEGRTLNANQQAPTILTIADLNTMTVETEISEADISKVKKGMEVYFTTLGNGERRWYSTLRQILPTPTVTNNVVLYTGLFDVDNADSTLLPEMTTQVYFVSSSAENVLVVPMGALTFIDEPAQGADQAPAMGSAMAAADSQAAAGGFGGFPGGNGQMPEITPEMRERFQQMRESGNFPAGAFAGRGGAGAAAGRRGRQGQPGQPQPAMVTVVHEDGTREERRIEVGLTSRVYAEVLSGLKPGEQVIAGVIQEAPQQSSSDSRNFRPPMMFR